MAAVKPSISITWLTDIDILLPVLQMEPPVRFWKVNEEVQRTLLLPYVNQTSTSTSTTTTSRTEEDFILNNSNGINGGDNGLLLPLPCIAEGASTQNCVASSWDEAAVRTRYVTEGCTVVVYTANGKAKVKDLPTTRYRLDDIPANEEELVCHVAFLSQSSTLVETVIQNVPNANLVQLGVQPQPGDTSQTIHQRKLDKLNGKLLYRGWILVWVNEIWTDSSLPALSPGSLWSPDVRYALFTEAGVAPPTWPDTKFLLHQMQRPAWPARNAKQGAVHYRLPEEPARRALVLLSERRFRDKKKPKSLKKALAQWESDWTNKTMLKRQASLYDQFDYWINRQRRERRYYKPLDPLPYRYRLTHWASTKWILHDLQSPQAKEFRCEWYKEVFLTQGSPGLALTHLLSLQEMERRMLFQEPDDHSLEHKLNRRMAFKEAVTDVMEWIPLALEVNRPFVSSTYQLDTKTTSLAEGGGGPTITNYNKTEEKEEDDLRPLYVRLISDRVMAAARKAFRG
jgi:hypothetical protein